MIIFYHQAVEESLTVFLRIFTHPEHLYIKAFARKGHTGRNLWCHLCQRIGLPAVLLAILLPVGNLRCWKTPEEAPGGISKAPAADVSRTVEKDPESWENVDLATECGFQKRKRKNIFPNSELQTEARYNMFSLFFNVLKMFNYHLQSSD